MANVFIDENVLISVADAIRAKTGSTDKIYPKDFSATIENLSIGGGSSEDVRYVTFMNGDAVLYVKPVAVGDDCVDVLAKGLIETPTKESTAQYNYAYSGWSLTDGGSADTANALANVTEDKTVYAVYTESVRYYTVTYYDEDGTTVLKTEQLAYGTMPSYEPIKNDYILDGWTPDLAIVTSDTSYVAVWTEKQKLADYTWEEIIAFNEQGVAQDMFSVGDTKQIVFTYDGDEYNNALFTVMLIGFNHDNLADNSGKASMSFMYASSGLDVYTCWGVVDTYPDSFVYKDLNSKLTLTDTTLANAVKTVKKEYVTNITTKETSTIDCKFWSLSPTELGYTMDTLPVEGEKYELFSEKIDGSTAEKQYPWGKSLLRTPKSEETAYMMSNDQKLVSRSKAYTSNNYCGYRFCFCI